MGIFSPDSRQLASGFSRTVQAVLLRATMPEAEVHRGRMADLIDGSRTSLIGLWNGQLDGNFEQFDPTRGDGEFILRYDLPLPPNVIESLNPRMGSPLWILGHGRQNEPVVLAAGLLFPLYHSAHIDIYHPLNGDYLSREYFFDPRQQINKNQMLELALHQTSALRTMGAELSDETISTAPPAPLTSQ